ncbi:MAG: hypothetical protein U1E25_12060 [Methylocystis sp.]
MIESRRGGCWRNAVTRPLAVGLFALVLLLQTLATLAALRVSHANRGPAVGEAGSIFFTVDGPCAADSSTGESGRHERDGRPPCCVLCLAAALGGLPISDAAGEGVAAMPLPKASGSFGAQSYDIPRKPPTGWATSWSSQAPPLFS